MKTAPPLTLPVGLAVAAAFLNASMLKSKLQPVMVVGLVKQVEAGEVIEESDLKPVKLRFPTQDAGYYFWPWDQREALVGSQTPVVLQQEQLVPKNVFHGGVRVPADQTLIGVQIGATAVPEGSAGLLSGREARIQIGDEMLPPIQVLSFRPLAAETGEPVRYQALLLVPGTDAETVAKLSQGHIDHIASLTD